MQVRGKLETSTYQILDLVVCCEGCQHHGNVESFNDDDRSFHSHPGGPENEKLLRSLITGATAECVEAQAFSALPCFSHSGELCKTWC